MFPTLFSITHHYHTVLASICKKNPQREAIISKETRQLGSNSEMGELISSSQASISIATEFSQVMQSHRETSFHRKHTLRNKWTYFANFQTQKTGLPPSCSSWYEDRKTARQRSKSPLKRVINLQQSLSQFCFKCSVIYCNINITYTEQTLNRGTAVRICWKLMVGNGGGGGSGV